ncbi:hypothetical protein GCM10009552_43190 [Rothia nasimurium]|nr:RHS repeat-associated core domain-containing protein [Luteibacter anthropi]
MPALDGNAINDIQADHLGTPRAVVDRSRNKVIWRWNIMGEVFGADAPQEDPDKDGQSYVLDMRFPGQRYDRYTGLFQNGFRDYDPVSGRYVQSDPIGLLGGVSTYSYVGGNPLRYIDPIGLEWQASIGFGATGAFLFGGLGGGLNISVTSNGQISFSATGQAQVGLGAYLGAGFTGGVSHTKCNGIAGSSSSTTLIAEADAGYGPSIGGSITYGGRQDAGASTGLGKYGVGGGVWAGVGASRTYTYTTPTISQMKTSVQNWFRSW